MAQGFISNQSTNYPFWDYYGYAYLGPIQIPPLATICAMTDRATNAVWYLCFDPCSDCRLALVPSNQVPFSLVFTTRVYGPYDGPFINSNGLRIGVRNARLLFEVAAGDSGGGPWAFDLAGNKSLWMQLVGRAFKNPNAFDHLAYESVPFMFFGLTDNTTGKVWYVMLDHSTQRVAITDVLPAGVPNAIKTRVHVYGKFDGPGFGTSGLVLGMNNGRMIANNGTKQFVLLPTQAFDSIGSLADAAQFTGATVNLQAGIADQAPDHVAYNVVDPAINECPAGSLQVVLTDDENNPLFDDDDGVLTP